MHGGALLYEDSFLHESKKIIIKLKNKHGKEKKDKLFQKRKKVLPTEGKG